MRIDRFLFFIRLAKNRTLAQSIVEAGYVRVDGERIDKPSEEVQEGSIVALPLNDAVRIIRVLSLPVRRGPASEARRHYQEIAAPD